MIEQNNFATDSLALDKFYENSDRLLKSFLSITQKLNEFHIVPYLMGSLAVELVGGFSTYPDDIDIQLRKSDFEKFELLTNIMKNLGYALIDLHEHKFEKDKVHVGFADVKI
ncbi:MAG: hypothetical protein LBV19_02520 [Streptococcaceae bacterium]|jgi:phosphoribosylanthranilate isomerase|nr:hypothetical protein [Streptococcaceae bacterium]